MLSEIVLVFHEQLTVFLHVVLVHILIIKDFGPSVALKNVLDVVLGGLHEVSVNFLDAEAFVKGSVPVSLKHHEVFLDFGVVV